MLSGLAPNFFFILIKFINSEPVLTFTLALGIVQEGGEQETNGGYYYRYFYCSGLNFFLFLALEYL